MKTSTHGVRMIGDFEGLRLVAYHLPGETWWTIGYGHNGSDVRPGSRISATEALRLLRADISGAERAVNLAIQNAGLKVNQNQFDALVSIVFNCGPGILAKGRSLGNAIRLRRHKAIQAAMMLYIFDSAKRPVLLGRRRKEVKLYGTPISTDAKRRKKERMAVQSQLRAIGWPLKVDGKIGPQTQAAIRAFQRGYYGFGGEFTKKPLKVDGVAGPRTRKALAYCVKKNGRTSPHFRFEEFSDHVTRWIEVHRELVESLEELRKTTGPLLFFSGYRDPKRGIGAKNSQHHYGNAVDPMPWLDMSSARVAKMKLFTGIGYDPTTGKVRHLDMRGYDSPNPTHSDKLHPAIFPDAY